MISFSVLPSVIPGSINNHNNSPKQARFAANAPESDAAVSQHTTPPSEQQLQTDREQSEKVQKAIEQQAYQEAIQAYTEKAGEIRAAAEKIGGKGIRSDKEAKDLLQIMVENNQVIHSSLTTYRRSTANSQPGSQLSSYPASPDSQGDKDMRVALYNQAITAYIRQKLFFSTISKVGHMVTV